MADRNDTDKNSLTTERVETVPSLSPDPNNSPLETNEFAHLTLKQSLIKWRRVTLYSLCMTSAILMYGYDYVVIGTISAMPSFQRDFGILLNEKWILPSLWLGLWNFISPGLSTLGAIASGFVGDRFGRRVSLALGSFVCAVGVAICFVSNRPDDIDTRRGVFLAGKGLQGGAIGMVMATAQTHMSEILPPNLRGPLLAFFPIFTLLGQVVGAAVIYACLERESGYVLAFASQWPFSALPLVMALVVPESPAYLIRRGREGEAFRAQRRLDGEGVDTEGMIRRLKENIEWERTQARATYQDSFRRGNLRRTMIVVFASIVPQLFGLTLLGKASYFIQIVGMKANLSVIVLILGIVCGLLANAASLPILARFGRRPLLISGLSVAALFWGTMGIAGIWEGPVVVWYSAAMMILVIVFCGLGAWPASHIVCAETSALNLRAKAQGIAWFNVGVVGALFGFVLPYIFNPDQGDLRAKTGFVFAGLCLAGVVITYFCVPEMKGRTPAEIDRMFELGLSAREFSKWKNPIEQVPEKTGAV
ncbi:alpha-glucosides permease MPH3-like protein 3 [Echria macrotheca]|uniref:Alpha-glucosides permease MPH3-like protein 3 n=1 Tax=Echria macrotheca TaxID=438768 RepID=A0AAJ0BDE9_9PEZI|nr:alpha-glucosides permease MPH3-like protein 3 [Echria macrotheca]